MNVTLRVRANSDDECFGVIIWEDEDPENDEQFTIAARDNSGNELAVTTVTISDDDSK